MGRQWHARVGLAQGDSVLVGGSGGLEAGTGEDLGIPATSPWFSALAMPTFPSASGHLHATPWQAILPFLWLEGSSSCFNSQVISSRKPSLISQDALLAPWGSGSRCLL